MFRNDRILNFASINVYLRFFLSNTQNCSFPIPCICPCLQLASERALTLIALRRSWETWEKPLHTYCMGISDVWELGMSNWENRGWHRLDSGSGKYDDSDFNPGSESCPISGESAFLLKFNFSNNVFVSHTSSYFSYFAFISLKADKLHLFWSLGSCARAARAALLLTAPDSSKMPQRLRLRLRIKCSVCVNKILETWKDLGAQTFSWFLPELRKPEKMGGLYRLWGDLNNFLRCLTKKNRRIEDLLEAERPLGANPEIFLEGMKRALKVQKYFGTVWKAHWSRTK